MSRSGSERLRLLVIGSTVVSAALIVLLGVPRARGWLTPRVQGVVVVSAALGDRIASAAPREVLEGTPVTLYALIEALPFGSDSPVLYGTVDEVLLEAGGAPVAVSRWKDWWFAPEFLWFKVEPELPFANPEFDPAFETTDLRFVDNYQVSWGFGWTHAADIRASGDAYPESSTGTMRFAARTVIRNSQDEILQRGSSPGADQVHAGSAIDAPRRVTVRGGDDAFGWFGGFAGLPYVPVLAHADGVGHPTPAYLGGTVLEFWLEAQRRAGVYEQDYVSWEQLPEVADIVVLDMFLANDGNYYYTDDPLRAVSFDTVQVGDILAIEDHVGILYEDRGPGGGGDGTLNRWDRALEAYFEPLRETTLDEAFVADVTVYRLRGADLPRIP